ncbi:MAG: elongation factor P-like protein YeiP [Gammaproteobacteria bacterium]|nr:elongation factor P-like protein YeiP [Gammaproteobacteria bacterium]
MKANEIKKGVVIQIDSNNILIKKVQVQTSSSRSGSTLYKVMGQNVVSRQKFERSFKGDEVIETVDFSRRSVQLLYRDADGCTFMDVESYEQYVVPDSAIEEELLYLTDGIEGVSALIADGNLLGIELPTSLLLDIVECSPGMKGASASARTKPATLSTGLVVQVPEYLSPGEKIKINTDTGEFMSRA